MIKTAILITLLFFFTACVNKHGISAKYYSECDEYYDLQGYYHKECGKDDIVTYEAIGRGTKKVVDAYVDKKEVPPDGEEGSVW